MDHSMTSGPLNTQFWVRSSMLLSKDWRQYYMLIGFTFIQYSCTLFLEIRPLKIFCSQMNTFKIRLQHFSPKCRKHSRRKCLKYNYSTFDSNWVEICQHSSYEVSVISFGWEEHYRLWTLKVNKCLKTNLE